MNHNLTDEEIRGMIYEADKDKDGEVSVDEFLRLMKKAKLM
jgi:calcium-binding protein CML